MKSPFAVWSLILPTAIAVVGGLYAILGPINSGDWLGMAIYLRAGIGFGIAGIAAIVLSITSFVRKEQRRELSLVLALPSILYLGWIALNLVVIERGRVELAEWKGNYDDFHQQLKKDPGLALGIDWEHVWDVRRSVLVASFQESSVPFTLEQLRELHAKFPSIRDSLFAHESCDSEFLSAHFEEALSRSRQTDYMILASICSNTNTPHKLLELVANAKDVPVGAVYPARHTLEKIRREQKRADQPATKPAEKPPVKDPPSTPASKDAPR